MKLPLLTLIALASSDVFAAPLQTIPGESPLYSTYKGKEAPWPGNETSPIPATRHGHPGLDDVLFQNLLSAEWIVFSFYQQAVDAFNASSFSALRLPNSTYQRVVEIRDNEAGHLRIFQDSISPTSLKPGPCKYDYGFISAEEWLGLQVLIEVSSMAFLTGLAQQAKLEASIGALTAIAATESRHNAWALIDVWNTSPFAGASDTVFPYAEQILALTNRFVVNNSCPSENPRYPFPNQHLPELDFNSTSSKGHPGQNVTLTFPKTKPAFKSNTDYYAVYFHGLYNVSVPFDPNSGESTVPAVFKDQGGIIIAVVSDEVGAPTDKSVVAGPLLFLEQPAKLTDIE